MWKQMKFWRLCGEFHWQIDSRPNDCGVFVMHHMEHYMGYTIVRWDCGLEDERRKQTQQLVNLRKKYVARLLLSECNIHKDKILADLSDIQVVNVVVKTSKVLLRGVWKETFMNNVNAYFLCLVYGFFWFETDLNNRLLGLIFCVCFIGILLSFGFSFWENNLNMFVAFFESQ